MRAHCERCNDDKYESSHVQEKTIQEQRRREGDCREGEGKKVITTADSVLDRRW